MFNSTRCCCVSLTIRVDESVYRNLVEVAKELGLSVDEIVNICLSNLSFLKMVVKEDVEGLSKVFSDVPRDRLASLALSRVLFIAKLPKGSRKQDDESWLLQYVDLDSSAEAEATNTND